MTTDTQHRIQRRNFIALTSISILMASLFWINDSYAIWQIWHNQNICQAIDCQREMRKLFWIDIVQSIIYIMIALIVVRLFIRQFDARSRSLREQNKTQQIVQDLYDNAPCGYHSLDENGVFIHINQTELNWLGYTREEVIGKMRLVDLQESFSHEQFLHDFRTNLKKNSVKNLEMNLRRRDGSLLPVLINGTIIRDENGNFKHTRTTLTDFSEQRTLLNELEKARQIAEKSVETKERFMANMSHEIRTPMNALIGFTNLLERTSLDEKQGEFVQTIKKAGENLMTLINDLLDFSKIEAGMLRIEATPFDLNELISSVETLFKPKAEEKRLTFDIQTSRRTPQYVIGDPTRVMQIITNLLSNAFKFTERGYVALTTELFDDNVDFSTIKMTIKDTGIGIETRELSRIFERFEQAQDDTTRLYGGSGLGLAIVKSLTEAMGGFVEVDSKVDFGSTFSVILPFKKMDIQPVLAQNFSSNVTMTPHLKPSKLTPSYANDKNKTPQYKTHFGLHTGNPNGENEKKARILVVEDNPMNQRLAALLLSDWGYDFDIVEDGKEAITGVQTIDYQLVLMDVQLPIMDGYEATSIIRNELKNPIPIIATTAHALAGEREKCLEIGMNDYISKPLQEDAVLAIIQKYIH
jgi:PAS domain S-box-containing protein